MTMLSNQSIVVILNPKIIDDLKEKGKIEKGEENSISFWPHGILHGAVNSKDINGLDEHIDTDEEKDVDKEFSFHKITMKRQDREMFPNSSSLLVAERLNGVEAGGFEGGIEAGK